VEIKNWQESFETNETRRLKHLRFVLIPNKQDGDGYTELLSHKNGAAHFGAWTALLQLASKAKARGTLLRDDGSEHNSASLERITRIPSHIWDEALPRFVTIGWLIRSEIPGKNPGLSEKTRLNRREEKGIEGKGTEEGASRPPEVEVASGEPKTKPPTPESLGIIWNECRGKMAAVRLPLNTERRRKARGRLLEVPDLERWRAAIVRASKTPFCVGLGNPREEGGKPWVANFEWLMRPNTLDRIEEGYYGEESNAKQRPTLTPEQIKFIQDTGDEYDQRELARRLAQTAPS
jgi:hypothetical protein